MSAVGRFIVEFQRYGLKPHDIYADASGLGIPMCDALQEAGWSVNRGTMVRGLGIRRRISTGVRSCGLLLPGRLSCVM